MYKFTCRSRRFHIGVWASHHLLNYVVPRVLGESGEVFLIDGHPEQGKNAWHQPLDDRYIAVFNKEKLESTSLATKFIGTLAATSISIQPGTKC